MNCTIIHLCFIHSCSVLIPIKFKRLVVERVELKYMFIVTHRYNFLFKFVSTMPLGLSATYFPENMLHNLSERVLQCINRKQV